MSDENGSSVGTIILSFVAGTAVGAGVALLLAPKTGKELRDQISELAEDAVDKIKDYTTEAQNKIKSTIEEGKELYSEKKSIITSAIEAGKEAMDREKERIKQV
jgi:gas vesicle protein